MPSYPGGKSGCGVYHRLAMEIPPHDERIVPFLGRCAIMRNVRPAEINIGIDRDADVLDQWTEDERRRFDLRHGDGVEYLLWRFGLNRWPMDTHPPLSMADVAAAVFGGGGLVPFIYCDPPYPEETLAGDCPYKFRFTDDQHRFLLETIRRVPALVMITSYPNELYERELAGWRTFRYRAFTRRGERTEQAWCNYPRPLRLHDGRFIGKDRRQRERIARKVRNCVRDIRRLPPAEGAGVLLELVNAMHDVGRYGSIFAGVCNRCLTVNPPDVRECPICRHRAGRPQTLPVFNDPCLQRDPPPPSAATLQTAAGPGKKPRGKRRTTPKGVAK